MRARGRRASRQPRIHPSSAAAGIELEAASPRVAKGIPRYPIPVALLARLAVDRTVTGRELGVWLLLRDAMRRTLTASEEIGIRALLVHAIDDDAARRFYLRHGSAPRPPTGLPDDPASGHHR